MEAQLSQLVELQTFHLRTRGVGNPQRIRVVKTCSVGPRYAAELPPHLHDPHPDAEKAFAARRRIEADLRSANTVPRGRAIESSPNTKKNKRKGKKK